MSPKNGYRSGKKSTLGSSSSVTSKTISSQAKSTEKKGRRIKDHEVYTIVSKNTTRPHNVSFHPI